MSLLRKPFHETIVKAIRDVRTVDELGCLGQLLNFTKVPKNHDEIIRVWKDSMRRLIPHLEDSGVIDSLLEQKEEAERETMGKAQAEDNKVMVLSYPYGRH